MDRRDKLEKVFSYSIGCIGLLGVLATVITLFVTLRNPTLVIAVIEQASGLLTPTPQVVLLEAHPLPTYTPYPTYTAYPPTFAPSSPQTATLAPTATQVVMSLPFEDSFDTGPSPQWRPSRGTWRMVDGSYAADRPS